MSKKMPKIPVAQKVPEGFTKRSGASAIPSGYDLYAKGSRFNGTYQSILIPKKGKK